MFWQIIVREAKRQNISYRPFAIRGIGEVAAARTDISMIDTVFDIVRPVVDMDVDGSSETKMTAELYVGSSSSTLFHADKSPRRERTLAEAVEALERSLRLPLLADNGEQLF